MSEPNAPTPSGPKESQRGGPEVSRTQQFVDKIVDRTTGLPRDQTPGKQQKQQAEDRRTLLRLGGMGLQFAGTVAIFLWIGYEIDRHYGWSYGATITMTVIALIGNLYLLIKEAMKLTK